MEQRDFDDLIKRIEKLEQEYAELKGQTEPIKMTRIEIEAGDTQEMNSLLKHILSDVGTSREKLDTLERGQQVIKHDIEAIHDVFVNDFVRVENSIGEVNATLSERFDHVDAKMATKDDITALKTTMATTKDDITALKTTQDEQGKKLDLILQLLQQKPPES